MRDSGNCGQEVPLPLVLNRGPILRFVNFAAPESVGRVWWAQRVLALRETTCVVELCDYGLETVNHHLRLVYYSTNCLLPLLWGSAIRKRMHVLRLHKDVALIRRIAL